MSGVIKLLTTGVPADAPRPQPGETPWISGQQQPVQIGVYRRLTLSGSTIYSYFDGAHWLWNSATPALAVRVPSTDLSLVQTSPWAGLIAPPPQGYGPMPTAWMADTPADTAAGAPC
jgi:hypothetical protein